MAAKAKVNVTMRALVQRINRKLAKENQVLKAQRGAAARLDNPQGLGAYYIVDTHSGNVDAQHVDPEKLGRELGVLQTWERLEE
ncbi:MAG TPA: hypothetical protein VGK17_24980 [Propionicimonas sp.]|jgi:hypothetical protein